MAGGGADLRQRCATCHGNRAEGKIGPNLTDVYWLHGGKPTQIYHTILEGGARQGDAVLEDAAPTAQVLAMAAYLTTLQGTDPPGAKAPQGEKEPI
jgi:cytochrome c oxidase cbb3-type subunit 3